MCIVQPDHIYDNYTVCRVFRVVPVSCRAVPSFVGLCRVLCRALPSFIELCRVSNSCAEFVRSCAESFTLVRISCGTVSSFLAFCGVLWRAVPSFLRFCRAVPSFKELCRDLCLAVPSLLELCRVFRADLCRVLKSFFRVVPSFLPNYAELFTVMPYAFMSRYISNS